MASDILLMRISVVFLSVASIASLCPMRFQEIRQNKHGSCKMSDEMRITNVVSKAERFVWNFNSKKYDIFLPIFPFSIMQVDK